MYLGICMWMFAFNLYFYSICKTCFIVSYLSQVNVWKFYIPLMLERNTKNVPQVSLLWTMVLHRCEVPVLPQMSGLLHTQNTHMYTYTHTHTVPQVCIHTHPRAQTVCMGTNNTLGEGLADPTPHMPVRCGEPLLCERRHSLGGII